MYRARRYWDNFDSSDPVTRAIAIVALILLAIFAIPYLPLPYVASGVYCYNLGGPTSSGSNQSLLGSSVAADAMRLELSPNPINMNAGDSLKMDIRFINNSMAPLTLFMPTDEYALRYDEQEAGLLFIIQGTDGNLRGEGAAARPPLFDPAQYNPADLHVLGPRQRCTITVTAEPTRLGGAQVGPGKYQIIAVYRNQGRGQLPPVQRLTPTPIFLDAGVWTGEVRSNAIILNYGVPAGS